MQRTALHDARGEQTDNFDACHAESSVEASSEEDSEDNSPGLANSEALPEQQNGSRAGRTRRRAIFPSSTADLSADPESDEEADDLLEEADAEEEEEGEKEDNEGSTRT